MTFDDNMSSTWHPTALDYTVLVTGGARWQHFEIEHPITGFPTWKAAFDRRSTQREQGGARRYRIFQPVDDPAYILVDLDFDQLSNAEEFLAFLQRDVWGSPQASPALAGSPQTRIIETVESQEV